MIAVARLIATLALAAAVGLGLTWQALNGRPALGMAQIGPWRVMSRAGLPQPDPYAIAMQTRQGRLPLAASDGLLFTASQDDDGHALGGRCAVELRGAPAPARLWTLTLTDEAGVPLPNPAGRSGFHALDSMRGGDGRLVIIIAPDPQPGNWLPTAGASRYRLILRLYDTPAALTIGQKGAITLPRLRQLPC